MSILALRFAWRQLRFNRTRLFAAVAGVLVAVLLMLVQLGFLAAAYESALGVPRRITADLIVTSWKTQTVFRPTPFPRVQLYRLPADPDVLEIQSVYMANAQQRNPWSFKEHPIFVYGLDPSSTSLQLEGGQENALKLLDADTVVYDRQSRPFFGPIGTEIENHRPVTFEVNHRNVTVVGLTRVGITLGIDGSLFTTQANFLRLFPQRKAGAIDLGLVTLRPNVDRAVVRERLQAMIGSEAQVFTQGELVQREHDYLRDNEPIEFIFTLGSAVGFFIGCVIVYQILYTDVLSHLPQFATLKAMGFSNSYLVSAVIQESLILAVLGFIPGTLLSWVVYIVAEHATLLPLQMTIARLLLVFSLTVAMCSLSGLAAVSKLRNADPADVF